MNPNEVDLYAGLVGLQLGSIESFQFCEGLLLRPTYAHVFSASMIAFSKPAKKGLHHPIPWKALNHGFGYDISAELFLESKTHIANFDRLSAIWWIASLSRLVTGASIQVATLSSAPFSQGKIENSDMEFWPIEISHSSFVSAKTTISSEQLEWLKKYFLRSSPLMDISYFNRAFQAFDNSLWLQSLGSAILMIWSSLETLMRPGRQEIGKTLAQLLATFLYDRKSERDKMFAKIRDAYEARGRFVHNSIFPELDEFNFVYGIARAVFKKCIEESIQPNPEQLLEKWKNN